ncbi:MAG: hypothetical protein J6V30_04255 [Paludibacteraceae bacterium]|nr:hypothetical protein [Paludibacteraceae bacterium]
MKKVLSSVILFAVLFSFVSCNDEQKEKVSDALKLNGYWQCTSIGGEISGIAEGDVDGGKYTKLMSIGFLGTTSTGKYARVGGSDVEGMASMATAAYDLIKNLGSKEAWEKLLTAGSYTIADGVITLTPKDGSDPVSYKYSFSEDGNTLTLSQEVASASDNETVNTIATTLNSILSAVGKQEISTSVNVSYTYKKVGVSELKSLFTKEATE